MKKYIVEFVQAVRALGISVVEKEDEIICGGTRVRIFDDSLFCEFPPDGSPSDIMAASVFMAALVGLDSVHPLLARMKDSLHSGQDHSETLGQWHLNCSEVGSFQTIEAKYRP